MRSNQMQLLQEPFFSIFKATRGSDIQLFLFSSLNNGRLEKYYMQYLFMGVQMAELIYVKRD